MPKLHHEAIYSGNHITIDILLKKGKPTHNDIIKKDNDKNSAAKIL